MLPRCWNKHFWVLPVMSHELHDLSLSQEDSQPCVGCSFLSLWNILISGTVSHETLLPIPPQTLSLIFSNQGNPRLHLGFRQEAGVIMGFHLLFSSPSDRCLLWSDAQCVEYHHHILYLCLSLFQTSGYIWSHVVQLHQKYKLYK